jgi:hypothetical protein
VSFDSARLRDLDEPVGVRTVPGPDDQQEVDAPEQALDRPLSVRRRVADVVLLGSLDSREAAAENADDLARVVDRERRLGDEREPLGLWRPDALCVGGRLHKHDRVRRLTHRPDDLLMAGVTDKEDGVAAPCKESRLRVHLGDEGAGGVDRVQAAGSGVRVDARGNSVRGEDEQRAFWHVFLVLDENRPT